VVEEKVPYSGFVAFFFHGGLGRPEIVGNLLDAISPLKN